MIRGAVVALLAAVAVGVALAAMVRPAILIGVAVVVVSAPFSKIGRVLLAAVAAAAAVTGGLVIWFHPWMLAAAVVLLVAWPGVAVYRFIRSTPATRRNYPAVIRARIRWRWLARNVGLAPIDRRTRHAARGESAPLGWLSRAWLWNRGPEGVEGEVIARTHYPRARIKPDDYGFTVDMGTVPGVSRLECEKAAPHLANYWSAVRVGISQPRPGRIQLRAMRRDPLAEPLGSDVLPQFDGRRLLLGRDEYGGLRHASLAGLSGSVIGGSPGRGKSQCAAAFAVQLAPVPTSDWYVLDGGGGADWSCWEGRATRFATDDLAEARDVLEDAHAGMVKRLATLTADLGTRNAWIVGPSPDYRFVWVPIDESSVYLDLETAKALGKEAEQHVRAMRGLVGGMLRRGRKVLYHVTLMAQKCSSSSIPPDLRDLAGLRLAFGCPTTENAVAVLGDDIRTYPTLSPTSLQGDEHAGVTVARLRTGADPYTRLRVPFVDEDQADELARATACRPPSAPLRLVAAR
jgi:S-DNA-T family DNA segregation ATPase FtsK/SpoIIIE